MAAKTSAGVDVARRLRELREERGIPKERVALAFEMSAENWRHYESGRNQLAVTMLPTIAAIYDISVENLLLELFELRTAPAGRSESDTTRHGANQSGNGNIHVYSETDRRGFGTPRRTSRVLALA